MTKKSGPLTLILLVVALLAVGITLIVIAYNLTAYDNEEPSLLHHLTRDIGIAFIVSGLVTFAYETYARTRFDLGKISSLLETVYGSGVPPPVWESIKETLLERELIRRNVIVRLRVFRNPNPTDKELVLEVDLAYELQNLLSKEKEFIVSHGLDEHITATDLPCFVNASIGERTEVFEGESFKTADGVMEVHDGRLDMKVTLRRFSDNAPVFFRIRRREARDCPGSYYLIMTEVTERLRVYLDECADDVAVELIVRPREGERTLRQGDVKIIEEPLLPGHGLEFKFRTKPTENANVNEASVAQRIVEAPETSVARS
ncbi:MAG TPA: hypothetical protein VFH31_17230, partial [Pyrinomonadaceae bacterium]|nr:hypothetical protein [Pyrinomonadaceae bacterium]